MRRARIGWVAAGVFALSVAAGAVLASRGPAVPPPPPQPKCYLGDAVVPCVPQGSQAGDRPSPPAQPDRRAAQSAPQAAPDPGREAPADRGQDPQAAPPTPKTPSGWPNPQAHLEENVAHGWCVSAGYPRRYVPCGPAGGHPFVPWDVDPGRPVVEQCADASVLWAEQKVPLENPSPLARLCAKAAAEDVGPAVLPGQVR